jgi:ribonuclease BN (tRNA processing enzyme)
MLRGVGAMNGLTLTVLGCDGSYAGPGGACSGYLLSHGDVHVWLDCGPGTLANIQRHVALADLSAIVISHSHPDHWVELPVVHNALRYYLGRGDVPLYSTADTLRRFDAMKHGPINKTFIAHPITDGSTFDVHGMSFTTSVTDHPVETLAVRVDAGGRSATYSADTGPGWSLAALGPVDVALCEATLRAHQADVAVHLTTTQAGRSAREAGARRLIITHLPPGADAHAHRVEAAEAYGADVEVATMNARYEI